jgi:hypothetical protein
MPAGLSNKEVANLAVEHVIRYERGAGRRVTKANHRSGYDLVSRGRGGPVRYIEVKGTAKSHFTIPDMAASEFDEKGFLKASHLYVVANLPERAMLYRVSREKLYAAGRVVMLRRLRVPTKVQKLLRAWLKGKRLRKVGFPLAT